MPGRNHAIKANQIARVAQLYADGYSRREIAAYFGLGSDMGVRSALKLARVKPRDRKEASAAGVKRWALSRRRVASVFDLGSRMTALTLPTHARQEAEKNERIQ